MGTALKIGFFSLAAGMLLSGCHTGDRDADTSQLPEQQEQTEMAKAAYSDSRARTLVDKFASEGQLSADEYAEVLAMLESASAEMCNSLQQAVAHASTRSEALENIGAAQDAARASYKYLEPLGRIMELAGAAQPDSDVYVRYTEFVAQMKAEFGNIEQRLDREFPITTD